MRAGSKEGRSLQIATFRPVAVICPQKQRQQLTGEQSILVPFVCCQATSTLKLLTSVCERVCVSVVPIVSVLAKATLPFPQWRAFAWWFPEMHPPVQTLPNFSPFRQAGQSTFRLITFWTLPIPPTPTPTPPVASHFATCPTWLSRNAYVMGQNLISHRVCCITRPKQNSEHTLFIFLELILTGVYAQQDALYLGCCCCCCCIWWSDWGDLVSHQTNVFGLWDEKGEAGRNLMQEVENHLKPW